MADLPPVKLSEEDRKRFDDLFKKLDVNENGKIEVKELATALKEIKGVSSKSVEGHAQEIMAKADKDADVEMDFAEFIQYMQEHEKKLRLAFSDMDKDKDGKIEPIEVKAALAKLGLSIDLAEAEKLTRRIDKDGDLCIDWKEWREFFGFCPHDSLEELVSYWRHSVMIDIGDNLTVPPEFTQKEKKTGMWWRHLVAGGLAGAVSRTCTAPLDRVKIMLQVHGPQEGTSIVGLLKNMVKEGGVKALWRGNGTNVMKIAPESAIKFGAYEKIKRMLKGDSTEISIVERFAAGSSAGAFAQTCIYPLEVVKTRLAVGRTGQYKGMIDCGISIFQKEGVKAMFRGYVPNLIGIIPYAGIDLTIYESLKQAYMARNPENPDPGVLVLLACGTTSSTCGQLASYPLALVRTRLQAGAAIPAVAGQPPAPTGFGSMVSSIVQKDGFRGLYRGIAPNFLKVLPAVSISYVIYERTKGALGVHK